MFGDLCKVIVKKINSREGNVVRLGKLRYFRIVSYLINIYWVVAIY